MVRSRGFLLTQRDINSCRQSVSHFLHLENRGHQVALTKFRISSYNLRIETGWYENNPKLEPWKWLCIFCDRQAVENEIHFLLECPLYTNERIPELEACKTYMEHFDNMGIGDTFITSMKNKQIQVIDWTVLFSTIHDGAFQIHYALQSAFWIQCSAINLLNSVLCNKPSEFSALQ